MLSAMSAVTYCQASVFLPRSCMLPKMAVFRTIIVVAHVAVDWIVLCLPSTPSAGRRHVHRLQCIFVRIKVLKQMLSRLLLFWIMADRLNAYRGDWRRGLALFCIFFIAPFASVFCLAPFFFGPPMRYVNDLDALFHLAPQASH